MKNAKTSQVAKVAPVVAAAPVAAPSGIAAMVSQLAAVVAPVAKPATTRTTRPAASSATAKPKAIIADDPIKFIVRGDGATHLFAHTAAWLELTGLIYGQEYPADKIKKLGGTAYTYHTKQGNFAESQGMARLTAKGLAKFQAREMGGAQGFAAEDKDHYILMMQEGLHDARLVKNEATIIKA